MHKPFSIYSKHTKTTKNIAEKRTKILYDFLKALEEELYEI